MSPGGQEDGRLDLGRRNTWRRPDPILTPAQECRADIERIADAVLDRIARAHAIAAIVIDYAREQSAGLLPTTGSTSAICLENLLDVLEGVAIDDRLVLALEPGAAVAGLA